VPTTKIRFVSLGLVAGLLAACGHAAVTPPPSTQPTVEASVERDGIRVTLGLEGAPTSGRDHWADGRVENLGTRAVRWVGLCDVAVGISIDLRPAFDPGRTWTGRKDAFKQAALFGAGSDNPVRGSYIEASLVEPPGEPVVCLVGGQGRALEPGASMSVRSVWNGLLGEDRGAPAGPARLTASFGFVGFADSVGDLVLDSTPIEVSVDTTIAAGSTAPLLAPGLAIDAALADPEFGACVDAADPSRWLGHQILRVNDGWTVFLTRSTSDLMELGCQVNVGASGEIVGRAFGPAS
jgi:hypothetical protein